VEATVESVMMVEVIGDGNGSPYNGVGNCNVKVEVRSR